MSRTTLNFALLLIALGVIAYFATGMVSMTALIPAFFGLPIAVCALAAARFGRAAFVVALFLCAVGTLGIIGRLIPMATRGELEFNAATMVQVVFALVAATLAVLLARGLLAGSRGRSGDPEKPAG